MSSKSIIVFGIVATFSLILVVSISMGYGANQYLFQDGSTPLTADWNAGTFKIIIGTLDTGQGANELYAMDQDLKKINSPTFNNLYVGQITQTWLHWMQRSNPNYFLRMLDTDLDNEWRWYVNANGIFIQYVWDNASQINRVVYNLKPSEGTMTIRELGLAVVTTEDIVGGSINIESSYIWADTENLDPTDDLDTITTSTGTGDLRDGHLLIIRSQSSARDITVKDNTGNIQLDGNVDFTLSHVRDRIMLMWDSGLGLWLELSRSDNA